MKLSIRYLLKASTASLFLCLHTSPSFALEEYDTHDFKSHKQYVTSHSFQELKELKKALIEWRTKIDEDIIAPEAQVRTIGNRYKLEVTDLVPEIYKKLLSRS